MKRLIAFATCAVFSVVTSGCGTSKPKTEAFVTKSSATAIAATSDGGLVYSDSSGLIYSVDKDGKVNANSIGKIVKPDAHGILSLVQDSKKRIFASWIEAVTKKLVVAQVSPGTTRFIYRASSPTSDSSSGRLVVSPENRVLIAATQTDGTSAIVSVDPDRNSDQAPNVISKNWKSIHGMAYATGGVLWAIDTGTTGDRIARAGDNGPTGKITITKSAGQPTAMTAYGDTEFAFCFAQTHQLQRYTISDGVQVLSGRVLAKDCSSDVTQLSGGRLAYIASGEIRVTAL